MDPIAASIKLPNIVIETYQNKVTGDLTTGPAGTEAVNVDMIDELSMVLSCPTSLSYICSFQMAHKLPHFVITDNRSGDSESHAPVLNTQTSADASLLLRTIQLF